MVSQSTNSLLREVARLHSQIQREGAACCGGTTTTQCSIFTEIGRGGPMTLADLGRRLGVDKGWVSRAVESMVQEGLLNKEPGPADRRTIMISFTDAGRAQYEQLNQTLNAQSARVMSRIPAPDRAGVVKSLELLLQALRAESENQPIPISLEGEILA